MVIGVFQMKVLVLHPPMYPVNYDFYNRLGNYVDLVVFQFGEYPSDHPNWTFEKLKYKAESFDLHMIGKNSDSLKNQLFGLKFNSIKEMKPDIVLSIAFWIPSLYFSLLSKILDFKLIILTNAIEATEKNSSLLRKLFRKIICINTHSFISASSLTSQYLQSLCPHNNIHLSLQTIETKKWSNVILSLPSQNDLRNELNLPNNTNILLGVGNFSYKKNWTIALESMKQIENCLFVLIGSGIEHDHYISYINDNDLSTKVLIIDRKEGDALKKYFKASDFFVLPSLYEQFGFVVPEALSSDLPVLCSQNTGASSLIKNDYNGYVIDPEKNFALEIEKVIKRLDTMKKNAYESVKDYTLENRAEEFYSIFQKVMR